MEYQKESAVLRPRLFDSPLYLIQARLVRDVADIENVLRVWPEIETLIGERAVGIVRLRDKRKHGVVVRAEGTREIGGCNSVRNEVRIILIDLGFHFALCYRGQFCVFQRVSRDLKTAVV